MSKDEALDLAMEALENWKYVYPDEWDAFDEEVITAIKQARSAPVQEPFGYLEIEDIESHSEYPHNCRSVNLWHEGGEEMVAIYTTPPAAQRQWVGLTDEERNKIRFDYLDYDERARAIEAKLKEKNNG
jgi:hypothetical protein